MNENKPPGRVPLVTVHLDDGESFPPSIVQEHPPWVIFQTTDESRQVRAVVVPEHRIAKVDLRFVASEERVVGFRLAESDEDLTLSE